MIINLIEYDIIITIYHTFEKPPFVDSIALYIQNNNDVSIMVFYQRQITNYRYSTYDRDNKFINILIKSNIIESCGAEICLKNEILLQLI